MIEDRIEKQLHNRIIWALKEHQEATKKLYDLLAGMEGLKGNPKWLEITHHLADCESHLVNARRRLEPDQADQGEARHNGWLDPHGYTTVFMEERVPASAGNFVTLHNYHGNTRFPLLPEQFLELLKWGDDHTEEWAVDLDL